MKTKRIMIMAVICAGIVCALFLLSSLFMGRNLGYSAGLLQKPQYERKNNSTITIKRRVCINGICIDSNQSSLDDYVSSMNNSNVHIDTGVYINGNCLSKGNETGTFIFEMNNKSY